MQDFILLSELKKKAYKKSVLDQDNDKSSKIIQTFIGINNVNKEWFEEAKNKYQRAQKSTGISRIHLIQNALIDIYCCEYAMKTGTYQDKDVSVYVDRIETNYLNFTLEFIETYIHQEKSVLAHYHQLSSAVAVLEETDSKMAAQYRIMLNRQQSLLQSVQKIQKTLDTSALDLTDSHFQQISNILQMHENTLKLSPGIKEELLEEIRGKIDQLLLHYQKLVSEEEALAYPSLLKIISCYDDFDKLYHPFRNILSQKRYPDFLSKRDRFQHLLAFLFDQYPKLRESFHYYSLPRKIIDKEKLISLVQLTEKFLYLQNEQYLEIRELNPSLKDILQRFTALLSDEYKDDLVKYYKIENDIHNAVDDEEKLNEIIRFVKHLDQKINSEKNNFLSNKLKGIRENLLNTLDDSVQKFLKLNVPKANRLEQIKYSFDYVLNKLYDLGDLARIETFQTNKRTVLNAVKDLDQLIREVKEECSLYISLPESNLKNNIKHSLEEKLAKLNETLPLVNQYNLYDVNEMINTITMVLNILNLSPTELNNNNRLIILDQFTIKNYVILSSQTINIGRDEQNDIVLNCSWISGSHCALDTQKSLLRDLNSTNGTYYNHNLRVDMPVSLANIQTFNLAEALEFEINGFRKSWHFKLKRITDNQIFKDPALKDFIQNLFNTEFICLSEGDHFSLNKITGNINDSSDLAVFDNIEVSYKNQQFLITDAKKNIQDFKIKDLKDNQTDRFSFHL